VASVGNWTILGENAVAEGLREAARFVEIERPIMLATEPGDLTPDSFAIGPTILVTSVERVVPYYMAYEALGEVKRAIDAGEAGKIYGCFTSFRLRRGHDSEAIGYNALLPALAVTLDLLERPVVRVHATRASLLVETDAWFVTLRLDDDTIATIEAMATLDPASGLGRDVLVEVTGSDRVLRAEPQRQSVVVETLGAATTIQPWWEDLNERFLNLISERASHPSNKAGSRLRAIWKAVQRSAETGDAMTI
jgi:predicted dehydrogenase